MTLLDGFPLWLILGVTVIAQLACIELGFRFGQGRGKKSNKAQMAQVRAIMGASLGLLAFMLAFSFNTAQQHFEERSRAYLVEVGAIGSTFRSAGLLPAPQQEVARDLLREFAGVRLDTIEFVRANDVPSVVEMIRESERIHDALWRIAEESTQYDAAAGKGEIFAQSVIAMINAHDQRLQVSLFNRISPIIWLTLYGMAMLSMAVMGYQAGLTGTRSTFATWTLAITFAFVIILITDLDRPRMSLFELNQSLMVELRNRMDGNEFLNGGPRAR
ncbi:MAG: hypothetical protein P8Y54_12325 [Xanthomonadales bacterium]